MYEGLISSKVYVGLIRSKVYEGLMWRSNEMICIVSVSKE